MVESKKEKTGGAQDNAAQTNLEWLVEVAKRGVEAPESLNLKEIKQVCYALVLHCGQVGLG